MLVSLDGYFCCSNLIFNIVDKPSKENVVADFLSRWDLPASEEGTVNDQMPDEHLFSILVLSPWFANIANYLVSTQFPPHLS